MVEGAPLLREYTGNGIEGSNPFVSAIITLAHIANSTFAFGTVRLFALLFRLTCDCAPAGGSMFQCADQAEVDQ